MMRFTLFLVLACFAFPALAKYEPWPPQKWPPFQWPETFSVTTSESREGQRGAPVTNSYYRDDELARIDVGGSRAPSEVQVYDMDARLLQRFVPGGAVQQSAMPEGWALPQFFPEGQWEALGIDPFNGKKSLKYKIWRDAAEVERTGRPAFAMFWLTPDHKTPLRLIDGERRIDFLDYSNEAPDEALFELPGAQ